MALFVLGSWQPPFDFWRTREGSKIPHPTLQHVSATFPAQVTRYRLRGRILSIFSTQNWIVPLRSAERFNILCLLRLKHILTSLIQVVAGLESGTLGWMDSSFNFIFKWPTDLSKAIGYHIKAAQESRKGILLPWGSNPNIDPTASEYCFSNLQFYSCPHPTLGSIRACTHHPEMLHRKPTSSS